MLFIATKPNQNANIYKNQIHQNERCTRNHNWESQVRSLQELQLNTIYWTSTTWNSKSFRWVRTNHNQLQSHCLESHSEWQLPTKPDAIHCSQQSKCECNTLWAFAPNCTYSHPTTSRIFLYQNNHILTFATNGCWNRLQSIVSRVSIWSAFQIHISY